MFLFHVTLAAFAFASFADGGVVSPLLARSNGDQYERREGRWGGSEQPQVEIARSQDKDATDRKHVPTKVFEESTRRNVGSGSINNSKARLNVDDSQSKHGRRIANDLENNRNKRSYYPYTSFAYQVPQFQSLSAWRPAVYPLQRPYYIPVFGVDGRIPIYIPQQPIYLNPGTPPQNPEKPPYVGPTYLPPTYLPPVTSSPPTNATTMAVDDRFGNTDDDDRPIWDNSIDISTPSTNDPSGRPTRKPSQSSSQTFPPLVHKDGSGSPPFNHLSTNEIGRTTTTAAPVTSQPPGPSRCVWAIVSCCSTASKVASMSCFDQFGCGGPFWDVSPCETEYARAAIASAVNYYNSRP